MEEERYSKMVRENVETENLRKHMHAVSAIMEKLAEELGKDEEEWWKVGLLHDIDYEETKENPEIHGEKSAEILAGELPEGSLNAIRAHNFQYLDAEPETDLDHALIAADAISGLIVATALVMPNQKIREVRVESVLKKFNDSSFAKNVDRDRILHCEKLGFEKEKFVETSLKALKEINERLEL